MYRGNIWEPLLCFAVSICLASEAFGQNAQNTPTTPCASAKAGYVCDELATVAILLQKSVYKKNEPIDVELLLRAGNKGVYLPSYFGDFMTTCRNGFSASLFTLDGKLAPLAPSGCGGSVLHSLDDTALSQLHNFVRLNPGEMRTWYTTPATTTLSPGNIKSSRNIYRSHT
jgi:hypothetical protein